MNGLVTPQQFPRSVLAVGRNTSTQQQQQQQQQQRQQQLLLELQHPRPENSSSSVSHPQRRQRRRANGLRAEVSSYSTLSSSGGSANGNGIDENNGRRLYRQPNQPHTTTQKSDKLPPLPSGITTQLLVPILSWYSLGIISISTTKLLLSSFDIPPLLLTIQQLFSGSIFLQFWITTMQRQEMLPWTELIRRGGVSSQENHYHNHNHKDGFDLEQGSRIETFASNSRRRRLRRRQSSLFIPPVLYQLWQAFLQEGDEYKAANSVRYLILAGIAFAFGFLSTNFGFNAASASFVETIKAAEPLTSATLAVGTGLEKLDVGEWASLAAIIVGVLCSTLGNASAAAASAVASTAMKGSASTLSQSLQSCAIVMISNLCFSLRGLFQKFFTQANDNRNKETHDDKQDEEKGKKKNSSLEAVELQFRLQQIGVFVLLLPAIVCHGPWLLREAMVPFLSRHDIWGVVRYGGLATVNAIAFTSYNLASTYLLSKITVVHHAALNCIRRIFAIVVTSILFGTHLGGLACWGIAVSISGFMAFSWFKASKSKSAKA